MDLDGLARLAGIMIARDDTEQGARDAVTLRGKAEIVVYSHGLSKVPFKDLCHLSYVLFMSFLSFVLVFLVKEFCRHILSLG